MNLFLQDPNEIRLPPEAVRILKVQITPQPPNKRVKVHLELTPFMKRPNIEVVVFSADGNEVGHTSILETMQPNLEFTIHLRQVTTGDELTLQTTVYYQKLPVAGDKPPEIPLPDPLIVDTHKKSFRLVPEDT